MIPVPFHETGNGMWDSPSLGMTCVSAALSMTNAGERLKMTPA